MEAAQVCEAMPNAPPVSPRNKPAARYYFAYGGNMHLTVMAQRCSKSKLVGTAVLRGYRWQINQRGYANILQSTTDCVEGLVYEISDTDECNLDKHEGVRYKCYEKAMMNVTLQRHPLFEGQLSRDLAQSRDLLTNLPNVGHTIANHEKPDPAEVEVLVYISHYYVENGEIRPNYATRMNDAARDAVMLGVSQAWIIKYMGFILLQQPPSLKRETVSDTGLEEVQEKCDQGGGLSTSDPALNDFIMVDSAEGLGIELPDDLLQRLRDAKCTCASAGPPSVYLVEIEKDTYGTQPTIVDATTDPNLVNDLVVKHFLESINAGSNQGLGQACPGSEEWKSTLSCGILVLLELHVTNDVLDLTVVCRVKTYPLSQKA